MTIGNKKLLASCATMAFALYVFGLTPDTEMWQKAIDEKSAAGGGVVEVPAGEYVIGSLMLKDGVELRLAKGARLLGAVDDRDYVHYDNPKGDSHASVIRAIGAKNVAVTGEGTVDGRGGLHERRIKLPSGKMDWRGGRNVLYFRDCENVRVEGVFLTQPSSWTCFFHGCNGVVARKVRIYSHCNTSNDGFDVESSNVLIEDCDVDSEDDSLAIKSREPDRIVENVTVRRCRFSTVAEHIKFGTETPGVIRHVRISDCRVGCRTAPKFRNNWLNLPGVKTKTAGLSAIEISLMDGGRLEDVEIRNITIGSGVITPICIRYGNRTARVGEGKSWMKDILIENVTSIAPSESSIACSISGTPSTRPRNITLRNVSLAFKGGGRARDAAEIITDERERSYPVPQLFRSMLPAYGFYVRHVDGLRFENVKTSCADGEEARPEVVVIDSPDFVRTTSAAPTEVLLTFDTEDFTSPADAEGVKELATICTEEGVTAHFVTAGLMARALVQWGRHDVIEAMKPHLKLSHTLSHSVHPNLLEISDFKDFDTAYSMVRDRELKSLGMVEAATGADRLWGAVPPGNSDSYVALYFWARQGLPFYCGASFADGTDGTDVWFCNLRQIPYGMNWERFHTNGYVLDLDKFLSDVAKKKRTIIYCHPNKVHSTEFWDILNYKGDNLCEWGQWKISPRRNADNVAKYLDCIRKCIRALKADHRFKIVTMDELDAMKKPRRAISMADIMPIRESLQKAFGPVREPASWSLSDVFAASVKLLRGEKSFLPGLAYGFLEKPEGVTARTVLRTVDLRKAADEMDVESFLPSAIRVGGQVIGPADFLFAALDVLATGADEVVVEPKPQLPDYGPFPALSRLSFKGTWLHSSNLQDNYLSDRMRWQIWTLRYE